MNWMRTLIPGFNRIVQPLMDSMEKVYAAVGGRKKRQVAKIALSNEIWGQEQHTGWISAKKALVSTVKLIHPDPDKNLIVCTDASELDWGAVITQVPRRKETRAVEDRDNSPLLFLSGTFSGAVKRCAAHAFHLKFYEDKELKVTKDFLEAVAHNSEGHVVRSIVDHQWNTKVKRLRLLVAWRGHDPAENSWELVETMLQDVPVFDMDCVKFDIERGDFDIECVMVYGLYGLYGCGLLESNAFLSPVHIDREVCSDSNRGLYGESKESSLQVSFF
uniref:AlNc14C41G3494 protein n=1 Tax=Albugo laibachii Nc14 TaxID=890382 RepID=F0W9N9_9STRA|nr:AlNc14C41G3494 [Albugo laibachii Nc14]|eukprot:CCA17857.1 AlNc14C41G3494 [Albugo laibachii Nc14]